MTATAAAAILRRQGMPPEEIRAVVDAADPVVARRLLELHRERLAEWLDDQRRLVNWIERSVADGSSVAPGRDVPPTIARFSSR